jgi:hypothetical protein
LPPATCCYGWVGHNDLLTRSNAAEREKYRNKLIKQQDALRLISSQIRKSYSYQNHTFIPVTGLAVAAYALMAKRGSCRMGCYLASNYICVLATYSRTLLLRGNGVLVFSTRGSSSIWTLAYMQQRGPLSDDARMDVAHKYVSHANAARRRIQLRFGDIYARPITRARKGDDYERERITRAFEATTTSCTTSQTDMETANSGVATAQIEGPTTLKSFGHLLVPTRR